MKKQLSHDEKLFLHSVVGRNFPEISTLTAQFDMCAVTKCCNDLIWEFDVASKTKMNVSDTVLGQATAKDLDGIYIIITLLQKNGFVWHLDMHKEDGSLIVGDVLLLELNSAGYQGGLLFSDC